MARIVGVDIPNEKVVRVSLTYIYGIGPSHAKDILEDGWTAKTKDGKICSHYENTVVVTDLGYEILTLDEGENAN